MIGMSIKRISVLNLCHVLKPFVKSTPGKHRAMTEHSTKIYLWPSSVLNTFVKGTPGLELLGSQSTDRKIQHKYYFMSLCLQFCETVWPRQVTTSYDSLFFSCYTSWYTHNTVVVSMPISMMMRTSTWRRFSVRPSTTDDYSNDNSYEDDGSASCPYCYNPG